MFGFWAVEVAEDAAPAEIVQLGGELRNVVASDAKDLKAALSAHRSWVRAKDCQGLTRAIDQGLTRD